jgi:hypothetical protein
VFLLLVPCYCQEEESLSLDNSAAIFNCISDAPSHVTVLNVDDLIESAFHLTSSLNDDILRVQRQAHLAELQREVGEQKESPGKRKQRSASVVSHLSYISLSIFCLWLLLAMACPMLALLIIPLPLLYLFNLFVCTPLWFN